VWTALYVTMGLAAYLVWQRAGGMAAARTALLWFGVQLVLNGLWSVVFFGLRAPGLALLEIVLLWGAIVMTVRVFWLVRPVAGALLVPYLAWVTFATALNAGFWWLNRSP
jgi:tryptophan-rich sensory protein